jgi:hypothetical protein
VDLPEQGVDIAVTQSLLITHLAVGAEIADTFTEGDMDIQAQILQIGIGEKLVILIFECKGLPGPGQPGPGQIGNDTHRHYMYFR